MRGWPRRAVAVLLVALMVATATPAMAADPALEVASEHTTDSDFSGATITNMSVSGTGTSAVVAMDEDNLAASNDTFDDGAHTGWTEIQNSWSESGGELFVQTTANGDWIIEKDSPTHSTDNLDATVQFGLDNIVSGQQGSFYPVWQDANNYVRVLVDRDSQDYDLRVVSGGTTVASIDSTWGVDTNNHTIRVVNNSGNWELYLDGTLQGTTAATTSISGKSRLRFQHSSITDPKGWNFDYFDVRSGSAPQTAQYVGPTHQVSQAEQGRVDLTLTGVSATITWQGSTDGNTWNNVATTTVSSSGTYTQSISGTNYDHWRVVIDFSRSSDTFTAELEDEAVLFNAATPVLDDSSASPSGGETVTGLTTTLSIDVTDADFATSQSDSLTVEWYVDGSKVDTTTVNSNGTASTSVSTPGGGGTHTWHAVVTDSYGDTDTSSTFSFETPSTLFIRNESNVSQLVDNATVELTFYFRNGTGSDFSVTKTSSDGTVNMTGLPADQPFVVVAEANGYYTRRIFVPSLFETQTVYLLPQNETAVDTVFVIEDYTGDFPPDDTVLLVQRSLNGTWKTVLGDYFGATREFPGQVAYNERHRLVLMNVETGETRVMGTYTPITAATQEVVVSPSGDLTVRTAGATAAIRPQFGQLPALNGTTVAVRFENNSASVANWTVNASVNGTTLWLQTYASPQRVTNDLDLAPYAGETLTVRITYNDTNGTTFLVSERTFQIQQTLDNNATLLAAIQDFAQQSPQQNRGSFTAFLAMAITVLGMAGVASQFPVSSEVVALVGVFILTGFSVIGWVGYGLVFAAGVGTIAFAGLKRGL